MATDRPFFRFTDFELSLACQKLRLCADVVA